MHRRGTNKDNLLKDGDGPNEYWCSEYCNEAWIKIKFQEKKFTIAGVGFKSVALNLGHGQGGEPGKVKIKYLDEVEGEKEVELVTLDLDFEDKRNHIIKMKIPVC